MNIKVKQYLDCLSSPQKEIFIKIRQILLKTLPETKEEFKNGAPWYGKYYIAGFKNSVNIGFSVTGLDKDEIKLFDGNGKYMRHIKIHALDDIDETKLMQLFILVSDKASCSEDDKV